jgi:hypothetical protein
MQSQSPEKLAQLSALGATLQLDTAAASVVQSFAHAEVGALLLKGRSFARWLYPDGRERPYRDVDLLVSDVESAKLTLRSLGYRPEFDDGGMPLWWREHAGTWFRQRGGITIDLHRTLPGVTVCDEVAWQVLSAETDLMSIGGAEVPVLSLRGRAFHVALHAAQHGASWDWPRVDLERALAVGSDRLWQSAANLARELDATEPFAAGLNLLPAGAALAARLGLPSNWSTDAQLRARSAPSPALTLEQLAGAGSLSKRWAIVRRKLAPPPEFIRHWDPRARESRGALVRAYARRPLWLLRVAPRGFRAWYTARKASPGTYRR